MTNAYPYPGKKKNLELSALNLTPLKLEELGDWNPDDHENLLLENDPTQKYYLPIVAYGKRPMYELEQVLPLFNPEDFDLDPITLAAENFAAGHHKQAYKIIEDVLASDIRCIDAHAHLGNWEFEKGTKASLKKAVRHYETGLGIADLTLTKSFRGLLPWGFIDNRPYMRCLHGYGLCLWRLGKPKEAFDVFERMLWLNPMDNQGVRALLMDIDAGRVWTED